MKAIFNHCNINVTNLEKSIHFYKEALGLEVIREKVNLYLDVQIVQQLVIEMITMI